MAERALDMESDWLPTSATSKLSGLGQAISPQWIRLNGIANEMMYM